MYGNNDDILPYGGDVSEVIDSLPDTVSIPSTVQAQPASGYAMMLANPTAHTQFVPDMETMPSIITSANISVNQSLKDFADNSGNGLGSGTIIIRPRNKNHVTTYGQTYKAGIKVFPAAWPAGYTAPNAVALPKACFIPIADYQMSRDLSQSYTNIRPIASRTVFASSTRPTDAAQISGTVNSAAVNDLADFTTFSPSELADVSVTSKDYAMQIPIFNGTTYTPGPEILQPFTIPATSALPAARGIPNPNVSTAITSNQSSIPNVSYWADLTTAINATILPNTGVGTIQLLKMPIIPSTIIGGKVKVDIAISYPSATGGAGNSISVFLIGSYTGPMQNGSGLDQGPFYQCMFANDCLLYAGSNGPTFTYTSVVDIDSILLDNVNNSITTVQNTTMLLPLIGVAASKTALGLNSLTSFQVTVTPLSNVNATSTGPLGYINFQAAAEGQTLTLTQVVQYEAIPNGALAKDVKTSSYPWRNRDPLEITVAEKLFNSASGILRR